MLFIINAKEKVIQRIAVKLSFIKVGFTEFSVELQFSVTRLSS